MKKLAEVYKMSVLTNIYRYMTAEHRIQGSLEIFVCKSLWQVFN